LPPPPTGAAIDDAGSKADVKMAAGKVMAGGGPFGSVDGIGAVGV
jgi:hypothetical protein